MLSAADLIVAPATPAGAGLRAIVRLAGDGLETPLRSLFDADPPGFAAAGDAPRVVTGRLSPSGLGRDWGPLAVEILHWPGPTGPLGGPLAEVQLPASAVLVAAVLDEACRLGCRLARGGEFTLRAFLAGRLDLVQAEAVLAVVDATTSDELAAALDRMAAGAGGRLAAVRSEVMDLVADVEAAIDFADEATPDAVPVGPEWRRVVARIAACDAGIAQVVERVADRDAAAADLPRVVIAGPPNVGKSSLFNALTGRPAALVADEIGTTRDWLEATLGDDSGPRFLLVDVAGIRPAGESVDAIAALAETRAREQLERADLVICCQDAVHGGGVPVPERTPRIDVITRSDLVDHVQPGVLATSSLTGAGLQGLRDEILAAVARLSPGGSPATARLAVGCAAARRSLASALAAAGGAAAGGGVDEAIVAGHLRRAAEELAEITGASLATDLLDRIFSRHCIGK